MRDKLLGIPFSQVEAVRVDGEWIGVKGGVTLSTDDVVVFSGWSGGGDSTTPSYAVRLEEIRGVRFAR